MPIVDYLVVRSGAPARSGLAYDYVLAGDGVYIVADNHYLRVRIPISAFTVRGLPPLYAECSLLHGRLPAHLWKPIVQAARTLDKAGQEVLLTVRFSVGDGYRLVLPRQQVGPLSVRYARPEDAVLEVHSHRNGPSRFSATDTADEQRLRLYGVVGRLHRPRPEVALRVGAYGYFLPVPWTSVFDGDPASVHDANLQPPEEPSAEERDEQAALDDCLSCCVSD